MKKIIVMLAVLPVMASAQWFKPYDSTNHYKNEIHLNVAPFAVVAMGGWPSSFYEINYKRISDNKRAFRLGAYVYGVEGYYYSQVVASTDTSETRRVSRRNGSPKGGVKVGFELIRGKRERLKWFYGADLSTVMYNFRGGQYLEQFERDSAGAPVSRFLPEESTTEYEYFSSVVGVGISPFAGVRYPVSKRLLITAQVGGDLLFTSGIYNYRNVQKGESDNTRTSYFDFDSPGLISNVSVAYRF